MKDGKRSLASNFENHAVSVVSYSAERGSVEVAIVALNQRTVRPGAIRQIKGVQNRIHSRRRQFVNRSVGRRTAKGRGAVEVSVRRLNRRSKGRISVAAAKGVENG